MNQVLIIGGIRRSYVDGLVSVLFLLLQVLQLLVQLLLGLLQISQLLLLPVQSALQLLSFEHLCVVLSLELGQL